MSTGSAFASVPHSYRRDVSSARIDWLHTAAERHEMIAEVAYLIADRSIHASTDAHRKCGRKPFQSGKLQQTRFDEGIGVARPHGCGERCAFAGRS
jgi:hypothetical protein